VYTTYFGGGKKDETYERAFQIHAPPLFSDQPAQFAHRRLFLTKSIYRLYQEYAPERLKGPKINR
jgi:hypothetical protein